MRRQGKSTVALSIGALLLIMVGVMAYVFNAALFERALPTITLEKEVEWNLKDPLHVKIEEEAPLLNVDFELFATALKNLLDNALKYSDHDVDVSISAKAICVWSDGEKLDEKRLDFTKAFNRSIEGSTQGLGLGLYIAHEVVKKHGFRLTYAYEDGRNCFSIFFR